MNNEEKGKYCKGCAWRHIGVNVGHNHCDHNMVMAWNEFAKRVNGHLTYTEGHDGKMHLTGLSEQCRWFWDEKNREKPTKKGFYYKPSGGYQKCPKIPLVKICSCV